MKINPWFLILIIHIILSVILFVLAFRKNSGLRKENMIPIILIPIFGPLLGAIIEWVHRSGREGKTLNQIMPQTEDEDILWSVIRNDQENSDLIPLEEALLIDTPQVRRMMMLKALYDNPRKYINILMVAAHNDDVETAHYATTTISHEQRKFQLGIQKASKAYEDNPENEFLLDEYIKQIEAYINSGLLEEYLLTNQRIIYSKTLNMKISLNPADSQSFIKLLQNSIALKQYGQAFEISEQLKRDWPNEETTWIETVRACVEGNDREKLLETLQEIKKTQIRWTQQAKESIRLWTEGAL